MTMRKLLLGVLASIMVFMLNPVSVFAADPDLPVQASSSITAEKERIFNRKMAEARAASTGSNVQDAGIDSILTTYTFSQFNEKVYGDGSVTMSFDTTLDNPQPHQVIMDGSMGTAWLGTFPAYNAQEIRTVCSFFYSMNVAYGYWPSPLPSGWVEVTEYGDPRRASFDHDVQNQWFVIDSYSDLYGSYYREIEWWPPCGITQQYTATYDFGSQFNPIQITTSESCDTLL